MLHIISYLILKGVNFGYIPAKGGTSNVLRFAGKNGRYLIHEYHDDTYPNYYITAEHGGIIADNIYAIEAFDVVAALI